ncbi:MAG: GNAT family N-acetyltransferase [Pseudomonadota bacterium]
MAQIEKPDLRSERLVLRSARPSDVADRLALGNAPGIQRMFGMDPAQVRPLTEAAAEAWVAAQAREPYGWILEEGGRCIGSIRIHLINWADKRAHLSLGILDETKLGQGLGTEAMETVVAFAFGPLGLHRLTVRSLDFNERAISAYEKVGFVREGRERQSALIGAAWHDDIMLGLIAPDRARPRVRANEVRTARLRLRPLEEADAPRVVEILNDLSVSRWLSRVPHPFTLSDVRTKDDSGRSNWPGTMAIIHGGRIIGAVGTSSHLGYYLAPEAWGQGFMSEAVSGALAHVFEEQGRDEIVSGYFRGNDASRRILEKHGFRAEGTREMASLATGIVHDFTDLRLTRADWEAACSPS